MAIFRCGDMRDIAVLVARVLGTEDTLATGAVFTSGGTKCMIMTGALPLVGYFVDAMPVWQSGAHQAFHDFTWKHAWERFCDR
jgi:hypothetical protein